MVKLTYDLLYKPNLVHTTKSGNEYYCQSDSIIDFYHKKNDYYAIYYQDNKESEICDIIDRYLGNKLVFIDTEFLQTYQYIGNHNTLSKVQPIDNGYYTSSKGITPRNNTTVCFVLSICVSNDLPMIIWFSPDTHFTMNLKHCYVNRENIERRISNITALLSSRIVIGFSTNMDSSLLRTKIYDIQPIAQQRLFPESSTLVSLKTIYQVLFNIELDKGLRSWNWSICSEIPERYAIKDAIAVKDIFEKLSIDLSELYNRYEQCSSQKMLKYLRSPNIPFYYKLSGIYGDKAYYIPFGGNILSKYHHNTEISIDRNMRSYNGIVTNSMKHYYSKLSSSVTNCMVLFKSLEKLEETSRRALYQCEYQCLNLLMNYNSYFKIICNNPIFFEEFEIRKQITKKEIDLRFELLYKPYNVNNRIRALSNTKLAEYIFQIDSLLIYYYNNYEVHFCITNQMNTVCSLTNHNGEFLLEIGFENHTSDLSKMIELNNAYKQSNNQNERNNVIIMYCQYVLYKINHDRVLLNSDKSNLDDYLNILIVFLRCDYEESLCRKVIFDDELIEFSNIVSKCLF